MPIATLLQMEMAPNKPFYILHYTYGMDYKLTGKGEAQKQHGWILLPWALAVDGNTPGNI